MNTNDPAAAIAEVLKAVHEHRLADVKLLLHPYLRWTTPQGDVIRGRSNVLRALEHEPTETRGAEDLSVEFREGQVYRWSSR